jgi:DNA repair protein SbcC/Rad50
MIKSIVISNWRSHKKTEIEFSKGTNILVGIMGAGKSSVLEALCFGLYGNFPSLQKKKVRLSQISSRFALDEPTEVTVNFEKEDKKYSVKRKIEKGKSNAELREGNTMLETKTEAVTNFVERIINVDYNTFIRAIYTEQNSLDSFLNMNPLERKRIVDELMGIDKFELARTKITKLINITNRNLNDKLKNIENLNKDKKNIEKKDCTEEILKNNNIIEKNNKEIIELKNQNNNLENKIKEEIQKKEEYNKTRDELIREKGFVESNEKGLKNFKQEEYLRFEEIINERTKEKEERKNKLNLSENQKNEISSNLGKNEIEFKNIEQAEEKFNLVSKEIEKIGEVEEYEKIKEKIDKNENEIKKIEKEVWETDVLITKNKEEIQKISECKKRIEEIDKDMVSLKGIIKREIEEKKSELENNIEWLATIKNIIKENKKSIEMLKNENLGARCPVCETELSEEKKKIMIIDKEEIIKNSEKELKEANEKIERLRNEIKRGEEGIINREKYQKEKEELNEKLANSKITEEKIKEIELILNELKNKKEKLNEDKKTFNSKIDKAIKKKELEIKIEELKKIIKNKEKVTEVSKELNEKKNKIENEINELKRELEERDNKLYIMKNEIEKVKKDLELQKIIKEKKLKINELENNIEKINFNEEELEKMNKENNEIKIKLSGLETEKRMCETNLVNLNKTLKLIEEDIEIIEKNENEIKKLGESLESLKIYQSSLIETQITLRNGLIKSINNVLERVWKVLYPYGDYEKIMVEITDTDYVLSALHGNGWIHIEGNVSGGERASMILALKVAFSVVLAPHLSMLVLDEPTHNLDNNSVKSLCEILREKLPKIIKQVVVITHDENLKEGANGQLYIFNRNKDEHEPTKIEKISDLILNEQTSL